MELSVLKDCLLFEHIPTEIIIRVFEFLDNDSILRCSETCIAWRDIIRDSESMTQKLQVMKHGYLSHPFAVANFGVSPSAINEHIDAWRKLAYRRIDKIAFADNSGIWDLFGGVWAQGIVDSATRMTRRFLFHKLPSIAKGTDILTWEFEDVGMDVRDFRIDPDRDLMALIESPLRDPVIHRVHMRKLYSNGVPHRAAKDGVLEYAPGLQELEGRCSYVIELQGDLLGLLISPPPPREGQPELFNDLVLWNWTTGQVMNVFKSSENCSLEAFALIDGSKILLCLQKQDRPQLSLEIREIGGAYSEDGHPPEPIPAAEFLFATLTENAIIHNFTIRTDPPPLLHEHYDGSSIAYEPNNRIFVVAVVIEAADVISPFTLVVRLPTLLAHYSDRVPGTLLSKTWSEWGPGGTRMFNGLVNVGPWVCYVYGDRLISSDNHGAIFILDFNPLSARNVVPVLEDEDEPKVLPPPEELTGKILTNVVTTPGMIQDPDVFTHNVQTWLPYVTCEPRWLAPRFSHSMMDQEHILILDETQRFLHCLTF